MKAVILCAGYGERLKPFTDFLPKPLFPILGRPIIDNIIAYLKQFDVDEICINTHHFAHNLSQYLSDNSFGNNPMLTPRLNRRGGVIHKFYEASILGVAGGIGNMREYLQEMFIVCNCDVLTNLDLKPAIEFHKREKAIITLILHDYKEFNKIALSITNNNITSIDKCSDTPSHVLTNRLAFTGISIMSPEIFNFLPYREYGDILNVYDKLIPQNLLKGYVTKGHYWIDIGTLKNYLNAHKDILINKVSTLFWDFPEVFLNVHIGKNSYVSPLAQLKGFVSIGKNCIINDNVKLENCVVWDNIEIPDGRNEKNTIIPA